jgi:catechol 2,3-dioxygenase-like lactoylglutathione lyase family enzyme
MISLNHTVVTSADNDGAARFFAGVMGLRYTGPHPHARHFVPIRVNDSLTLGFLTAADHRAQHLAFDVDPGTFDAIVRRLRGRGVPFGDRPDDAASGRVADQHPLGARGLYFADLDGNLYELISPS